jgi:hypothetical protein
VTVVARALGRINVKLEADAPVASSLINYGINATLGATCEYAVSPVTTLPTRTH